MLFGTGSGFVSKCKWPVEAEPNMRTGLPEYPSAAGIKSLLKETRLAASWLAPSNPGLWHQTHFLASSDSGRKDGGVSVERSIIDGCESGFGLAQKVQRAQMAEMCHVCSHSSN